MLDLQEGKLLLILMEDGEDMEEELLQEKMRSKLIDLLVMLRDGLPKTWLPMDFARDAWFRFHMLLVFQNL